jgi:L-2,4-diaminobutyrate decarboxylase
MSFESDAAIVVRLLSDFYERTGRGEGPAIHQRPMADVVDELELEALAAGQELSGEAFERFLKTYLDNLTPIYHPGNMAHQQAVPHYMAALAGLIDHFVSSDGSIYELGPASVSIEYFLINWWLKRVGWTPAPLPGRPTDGDSESGGGILTHGGSLANLTALVAARSRLAPDVWENGNPADLVILAPPEAHYSVARAAGIMGMGRCALYPLEVDRWGVIRPERLLETVEAVQAAGKRVMALVANAGTTAAGLYDPLDEIGRFCRDADIWFHVDGAHGGPALLSEKHRPLMRGVELADSLTMNMHKLLRVTATCTVLLVRDAELLDRAFAQKASYLFYEKEQPGYDFLHRTIECTKPVQGLKLFLVLAALGEAGLAAHIERQFELTQSAYHHLNSLPDFQCPVEPQSNILCFRALAAGDQQLVLREQLLARGRAYVSTTELNGERTLRLTLNNPATGLAEVEALVQEIRTILAD